MSKKHKRHNRKPKVNKDFADSLPSKEPRISADINKHLTETPVWQINRIDDGGDWGWKTIGINRWENEVLAKLRHLETMTWAEIEQASGGRTSGNNSHFIDRNKLSKEAQKRLEELEMDDIDQVFSIRLASKVRIIGKRLGRVMQIMWFDFDHQICKSSKRNT